MAAWYLHKYTDRLTGDLLAIEIEPIDDTRAHCSEKDCECIPTLTTRDGVMALIHNAFDGRESCESGNKERGH